MQAEAAYNSENWSKTLEYLDQVVELLGGESNATIAGLRVKALYGQGNYSQAQQVLDQFYEMKSTSALQKEMGRYLVKVEEKLEAIRKAEIARKKKERKEELARLEEARRKEKERQERIAREKQRKRQRKLDEQQFLDLWKAYLAKLKARGGNADDTLWRATKNKMESLGVALSFLSSGKFAFEIRPGHYAYFWDNKYIAFTNNSLGQSESGPSAKKVYQAWLRGDYINEEIRWTSFIEKGEIFLPDYQNVVSDYLGFTEPYATKQGDLLAGYYHSPTYFAHGDWVDDASITSSDGRVYSYRWGLNWLYTEAIEIGTFEVSKRTSNSYLILKPSRIMMIVPGISFLVERESTEKVRLRVPPLLKDPGGLFGDSRNLFHSTDKNGKFVERNELWNEGYYFKQERRDNVYAMYSEDKFKFRIYRKKNIRFHWAAFPLGNTLKSYDNGHFVDDYRHNILVNLRKTFMKYPYKTTLSEDRMSLIQGLTFKTGTGKNEKIFQTLSSDAKQKFFNLWQRISKGELDYKLMGSEHLAIYPYSQLPDASKNYYDQAIALHNQRKYIAAIRMYDKAIKKNPTNYYAYSNRGAAKRMNKNYTGALNDLSKALGFNDDHYYPYYQRGLVFVALKQWDKAFNAFEQALDKDPDNAGVLNSYAWNLTINGLQLNKAEQMILKALKAEPDNNYYLDTAGWVYYMKGDYLKAENYIRQAIDTGDATGVEYEHMGDITAKLDRPAEAKKWWQKACDIGDETACEKLDSKTRTSTSGTAFSPRLIMPQLIGGLKEFYKHVTYPPSNSKKY